MSTHTATIHDLAAELDRLCPSQVDSTPAGNGDREAGHSGLEHDDRWPSVGWGCAGGSVGNSVFAIHPDDVAAAVESLRAMDDGALDDGGLTEALASFRVEWHT